MSLHRPKAAGARPRGGAPALLAAALYLAAAALLGGCVSRPAPAPLAIPQNPAALAAAGQGWCARKAWQQAQARNYLAHRFTPWTAPDIAAGPDMPRELAGGLSLPGYGAHGRPQNPGWLAGLWDRAGLEAWPRLPGPGITVAPCNLRVLPTSRPDFAAPPGDPQGYPFDRLQNSSLAAQSPVYIHHVSGDGAWFWVQAPPAWGWLPARDVARISPGDMNRIMSAPQLAVVQDDSAVMAGQRHLFSAGVGDLLPYLGQDGSGWTVLAAVPDEWGRAALEPGRIDPGAAARWPMDLCSSDVADLASQLMGRPYGWGGLYGWRDCSALTRQALAPFGLWLPRNSSDQAQAGARRVDLSDLSDADKAERIKALGIPWLTLLWMPGHVMLYVGAPHGSPLVLHAAWGVPTFTLPGGEGRALISRTAITDLHPGAGVPQAEGPPLIDRIQTMVILAPEDALRRE